MRQSVEDIRQLALLLGSSLDSTVIHEDFGQVVVRLEARELAEAQIRQLRDMASTIDGRGGNGSAAHVSFDGLSKRVYYLAPAGTDMGGFSNALKEAGIRLHAPR
ncbi:hypothetical protein HY095_00655 [Candidatus Micrarchaeota archaeon]|nr:hypothetical protein [Candidatus Micrarchaeota archaeon]